MAILVPGARNPECEIHADVNCMVVGIDSIVNYHLVKVPGPIVQYKILHRFIGIGKYAHTRTHNVLAMPDSRETTKTMRIEDGSDVDGTDATIRYRITGSAARMRIQPLLPTDWVEADDSYETGSITTKTGQQRMAARVDFLWENAPRRETRIYRDSVRVYSHLPNGTEILDSKWVLARLLEGLPAALETYCFRGVSGYEEFCRTSRLKECDAISCTEQDVVDFPDILSSYVDRLEGEEVAKTRKETTIHAPNWWVVKDASANGAGGVWVAAAHNCDQLSTWLNENHAYVAQRYAWPMVLYGRRKCHVRVYGIITSDGRAFVHRKAFLHVANHTFRLLDMNDSVHITNCCANSDDKNLFAGEICADLLSEHEPNNNVVPLGRYWSSIQHQVAHLARNALPFVQGGQCNNGFEYLGMDFILSYDSLGEPVAYLLEVNAPPSQDTATGLPHAEQTHNDVIRDLLHLWVFPRVQPERYPVEVQGGWQCVCRSEMTLRVEVMTWPSKEALRNKMRWALYERKRVKKQAGSTDTTFSDEQLQIVTNKIRSQFPYFQSNPRIFMENAGGAQVPRHVIAAMCESLQHRDRTVLGKESVAAAKETLRTLLGASNDYEVYLGSNASSLLASLANAYLKSGFLNRDDEIVLSSENHLANVQPWLDIATKSAAKVRWWRTCGALAKGSNANGAFHDNDSSSKNLEDLITPRTRIVIVSHASNIIGELRDIEALKQIVARGSEGVAHLVVDGVAAVPHRFAGLGLTRADWYVVSCHKWFGPHLGVLCSPTHVTQQLQANGFSTEKLIEMGTLNYEACEGVVGLGRYFARLSTIDATLGESLIRSHTSDFDEMIDRLQGIQKLYNFADSCEEFSMPLTRTQVIKAYRLIQNIERPLTKSIT